ncbi:uncharacterized protein LOC121876454 isoform X1 [Homarus americanus]|uniref:uncharacterized protein LOC121876454 isoform X1 n=1 Tax=Homarus americanus TaxID=6706 RepID=UPI001C450174|nr:uncharacterized protein LOC121876454 isoform X1 [Homarus americanus]
MKPMTVWATVGVIISITTLTHVTHARQAFKGDPGELGDPGFDLSRYAVSQEVKSRTKRYYLTFPSSSTLTFNNKIKIPLFSKFDSNIKGVFKGFIRAIYTLPSEIVSVGRSQIDQDRVVTYNSLESVFTNFGINGRECLLKAICKTAEDPADDFGLVGQLLGLVLSPTHGLNTSKDELHDHCIAESYGRDIGHCDLAYSSCPFNLGQLLTTGLSLLEGSLSGFPQA